MGYFSNGAGMQYQGTVGQAAEDAARDAADGFTARAAAALLRATKEPLTTILPATEACEPFAAPTAAPGTSYDYQWQAGAYDYELDLLCRDACAPFDRRAEPR